MLDPLPSILAWAKQEDPIRAALLLGSRADSQPSDALSDYDVALFCTDLTPYTSKDDWIHSIGKVWVYIPETLHFNRQEIPTRLIIYEGGVKVDFSLYPFEELLHFKEPNKPLLNKDALPLPLPDPNRFTLSPPSEETFQALVREFWFEAYHVSKYLKRHDLWSVKSRMAGIHTLLLKLIGYHTPSQAHALGKNMSNWVAPNIFSAVGATFAHFNSVDSTRALNQTITLFRSLAKETAKDLGFSYSQEVDFNISQWIQGKKDDIRIRLLQNSDIKALLNTFLFPWTTSSESLKKWKQYEAEQQRGIRAVFLLENQDEIIGYGSLLLQPQNKEFRENNIPEINDVWISENWRCQGLGTQLIHHLEETARQKGYSFIGLGVGLYSDYGQAQKLYINLGYIPNGQGMTYKTISVTPGKKYPVDDDLLLWLTKPLD